MMPILPNPYTAWDIKIIDPSQLESDSQRLTHLIRYGVLAASTFNAQPWQCSVSDNLQIYLDQKRVPRRSDKTGRFGHISLGCFIANIEIAAAHFGWRTEVKINDSERSTDSAATISLINGKAESDLAGLFVAISQRCTNRSLHVPDKPIPQSLKQLMSRLLLPGVQLCWIGESHKQELISLSEAADMQIWSDLAFRQEHVEWVRANWTLKPDGMPGFGVGVGNIASFLARPVILSSKFAAMQTAKNKDALQHTTQCLTLNSEDGAHYWINVGRTFERIALACTNQGVALAPMGQFIEHDTTRQKLGILEQSQMAPQFFCRIGYPSQPVKHSPRRRANQVLMPN